MLKDGWPWIVLAGLGLFHGLNPAMGWLFAVALGMHRRSRSIVYLSLLPIAVGHALAIGAVAGAVLLAGVVIDQKLVRIGAGALLVGWALYHHLYGHRHRVRVGMQTGLLALGAWSFAMATAHGAGLMLVPVLMPLCLAASSAGAAISGGPFWTSLAAVAVHTAAMLFATAIIAAAVYEWVGLAFLRRGWINVDRLWTLALAATGIVLLVL